MKKIISLLLVSIMLLGAMGLVSSCVKEEKPDQAGSLNEPNPADIKDSNDVKDSNESKDDKGDAEVKKEEEKKEKMICGVTDYEPMNFRDSSGNWTGFDTEFAMLVGEKLNMEVEFQEIEWGNKYNELKSGSISCIWNGFTGNASEDGTPRSELVDFSYSYMLNQQSIVIKADRADEFTSENVLVGKIVAAEKGSAGESYAVEAVGDSGTVIDSSTQTNTFIEVKSGAVDFAVVDILLAQRIAGSGDYSDLMVADIILDSEVYAVGFVKGSELRDKVNGAIKELYDDGTLLELAQKYGLENQLILDTGF